MNLKIIRSLGWRGRVNDALGPPWFLTYARVFPPYSCEGILVWFCAQHYVARNVFCLDRRFCFQLTGGQLRNCLRIPEERVQSRYEDWQKKEEF